MGIGRILCEKRGVVYVRCVPTCACRWVDRSLTSACIDTSRLAIKLDQSGSEDWAEV